MLKLTGTLILFLILGLNLFAEPDSLRTAPKEFQIHLEHPAKEIWYIMYEKDFTPIQGKISEDKKSIIIQDYKAGSKVRVKVEYEDGTVDEFVKSPCYIDPVITMRILNSEFRIHFS